jgi:hypothetical protein
MIFQCECEALKVFRKYRCCHPVDRMLQLSELGLPDHLTRIGEYASPPFRGEGHSRSREKEWEGPNSDEGTDTVVLDVFYVLYESNPLLQRLTSRFM